MGIPKMIQQNVAPRFWSKVEKTAGCWFWGGARLKAGYGVFQIGRKACKAHRVVYELTYGPIPPGLCVCHSCDNPSCVRPDHLWLGTHQDNATDRQTKGRGGCGRGDRHGSRTHPDRFSILYKPGSRKGENNGRAVLNWQLVKELRAKHESGQSTIAALSREYRIGYTTAHHIINHDTWKEEV